jgi:hypothetical protein
MGVLSTKKLICLTNWARFLLEDFDAWQTKVVLIELKPGLHQKKEAVNRQV